MKINKRVQMILLIMLLILCSFYVITDIPEEAEANYDISIVIRGKMDDSWSNIKRGAENAAEDMNVTLRFVAALEGNTAEEQMELLEQEVEGTDAIIISPVNRILLKDKILQVARKKPMVLMESAISGDESLPVIQSDNVAMGESLAQSVLEHKKDRQRILVLSGNAMCSSVIDRQKGFMKKMEGTENSCFVVSAGNFEPEGIYTMMKDRKPDAVVALDTKLLENLVKANEIYKQEYPKRQVGIYGYGVSSTVLKDLEHNDILVLAADDGFSIGYLCVQEAVNAIQDKKVSGNKNIQYILTNSSNMYSDGNQKLLFPFVK